MNIKSITLIVIFTISSLVTNAQFEAGLLNPLEAVYPDSNNVKFKNTFITNIAKNTAAEVHILIKSEIGNLISFSTQSKKINNVNWSVVKPVPVEQNTGIDSRTEQFLGVINPHVIIRAPFEVYEIIHPLEERSIKTKYIYSLIRLTVNPENFKSNKDYIINISISDKLKNLKKLKFKIKVHSVIIPELIDSNFFYTNWFNLQKMEEKHNIKRWSKKWYEMLDKYAQIMEKGRQNCIIIPKELISLKNNKIILDEKKMISFIEIFKKHGFTYFESPHLLGRGENDNWGNPELITSLRKKGYYSYEGKKEIDTIIHKIKKFTSKYNLKNQLLQHISDEPTYINAKCYQDAAKQIKSIYPEINIMEATNAKESLSGSIDLWCPLINDFQENEEFFRNREKKVKKY